MDVAGGRRALWLPVAVVSNLYQLMFVGMEYVVGRVSPVDEVGSEFCGKGNGKSVLTQ